MNDIMDQLVEGYDLDCIDDLDTFTDYVDRYGSGFAISSLATAVTNTPEFCYYSCETRRPIPQAAQASLRALELEWNMAGNPS